MFHFFVDRDRVSDNCISVIGDDYNHIKNVIRLKCGDEVMISEKCDEGAYINYLCVLMRFGDNDVVFEIIKKDVAGTELPCHIVLYQGIPKADKMELIIQKAVELGVEKIVPVAMKRCVVKIDDKKEDSKLKRWNAISESAAKQSKRSIIPQVCGVISYKQAIEEAKTMNVGLVPYENEEGMAATRKIVEGIKDNDTVAIIVGPEGGFEDKEIELAREAGLSTITLGKRILRTETAGMSLVSMIAYAVEDR